MESNGWSERTAAVQLFVHLDGEALDVALLMPEEEREQWEGLSNGPSEYYNAPGRLAVLRRRFESAIRRPGVDPAAFATELGILAVRGFGDMGKRARDSMIRDKFISAQRNYGLRRHLDGVSSDTPIRDIVDCGKVIRIGSRGAHGVFGNGQYPGLVLVRGALRLQGRWGRRMVSWLLGSHILAGNTTITNGTGWSAGG